MRRLIVQEFVALDGRVAGPNNNVDFVGAATRGDRSFGEEQNALVDRIDTIVLGRVTYQMFAEYWPKVTEGDERVFADKMNGTAKIVFSKTLKAAPWGKWPEATIVKTDVVDEVAKRKQQPGKDMVVWGSISLAQALIAKRMVDEYRLVFLPVVLGSGRSLFQDKVESLDMKLSKTMTFDRGAVLLAYVPNRAS